jgi:hypothetical protein
MEKPELKIVHTVVKKILAVGFIVSIPVIGWSQDATPGTLLPDIDPQDIEIRGDFTARFPGIMRQPILGFSPRPRVFQIDPNRMPYLESAEQVVASLPLSDLERPQPTAYTFYKKPEQFNLWGALGVGNYMAPEADIYMGLPIGKKTVLNGNFNSVSSGSYLENDDQTSSFRNTDAGLGLTHYAGRKSRFDLGFNLRSDMNHLVRSNFIVPVYTMPVGLPADFEALIDEELAPTNNIKVYGGQFGYRFQKNHVSFIDVSLESQYFDAGVEQLNSFATSTDSTGSMRDARFRELKHGGMIRADWAGRRPGNVFGIRLGGTYSDYNLDGAGTRQWYIGQAAALYRTRIGYALESTVGLRGFYAQDAVRDAGLFVYPELQISYRLTPEFRLKGDVRGFVENKGLNGLSRTNRRLFTYTDPENERGLYGRAAFEMDLYEGLKVQSGIQYTYFLRHAYYALASELENTSGGLRTRHHPDNELLSYGYLNGANILRWDAAAWYDLMPNKFTFYTNVYVQWHGDEDGNEIPFRENFGASAGGTYTVSPRTRAQIWVDYTGERKVADGRDNVNGYILLNAKFDFWASKEIGAYIKVTNLMDQRYTRWVGYEELPAQVYGGVMIKF